MITTNSFMKREFGKKLIEEFLPRIDVTHVIDASGVYIPGHGTPTVLLFGRHRKPVGQEVRAVMGIRGEPGTPDDPAQGEVWRSIVELLDEIGAQNEFVSVTDVSRETFAKHPWSIGGGGVLELKEKIENIALHRLESCISEIGRTTHTGEDEVFYLPDSTLRTLGLSQYAVPLIIGETVRDWQLSYDFLSLFPYDKNTGAPIAINDVAWMCYFWTFRTNLKKRMDFGNYIEDRGLRWFDHSMFFPTRFRTPLSIAFAEVATHNHFVLDRGGKIFKQTAPIIKLPNNAAEEDHLGLLGLLGLLNSSTACFWMKQVFHNKGSTVDEKGARQTTVAFENFYQMNGSGLQNFPVTAEKPLALVRRLDSLAQEWQQHLPSQLAMRFPMSQAQLSQSKDQATALRSSMVAMQEELDWHCYTLYGITDQDLRYRDASGNQLNPPAIAPGQRTFEIIMARKMAAGELETTWFERHGSTPITELPDDWPDNYRRLVEQRIEWIESNHNIHLIEQPEYKRRWNTEPWDAQLEGALRQWLLDRLETYFDFDGRMNPASVSESAPINAPLTTIQLYSIEAVYKGCNLLKASVEAAI